MDYNSYSMFHMTAPSNIQKYILLIYQKLHKATCIHMEDENKAGH